MTTATASPPTNGKPTKPGGLAGVTTAARHLPTRLLVHATEKWGKTSFAAQAPAPIFLCSRGETGLETLVAGGLLPPIPHFPEALTWNDIRLAVTALIAEDHNFRTLVIDTNNGASRLCEEETCRRSCHGNWEEYEAYGRGLKITLPLWIEFLADLDRLRERRKMAIILLTHSKIKSFKNPEGPDFDRYAPDMPELLWGVTHKWADIIAFGGYHTLAEKERGQTKAKGKGGAHRILYTERTAAFDAGNRYALPPMIDAVGGPAAAWQSFVNALQSRPTTTDAK